MTEHRAYCSTLSYTHITVRLQCVEYKLTKQLTNHSGLLEFFIRSSRQLKSKTEQKCRNIFKHKQAVKPTPTSASALACLLLLAGAAALYFSINFSQPGLDWLFGNSELWKSDKESRTRSLRPLALARYQFFAAPFSFQKQIGLGLDIFAANKYFNANTVQFRSLFLSVQSCHAPTYFSQQCKWLVCILGRW